MHFALTCPNVKLCVQRSWMKRNKRCYILLQICWNGIMFTSVITLSCYLQCRKKLLWHFWNIKVNHKWPNKVGLLEARLEVSSWRKPWEWRRHKEVCRNQWCVWSFGGKGDLKNLWLVWWRKSKRKCCQWRQKWQRC